MQEYGLVLCAFNSSWKNISCFELHFIVPGQYHVHLFTKKYMQVFIVTVTVVKAEAQRDPCRIVLMDGDVRDRRPQSRQLLSNFLSKPPRGKCHTPLSCWRSFSGWRARDEWILIQSRCAVRWLGAEAQWWSLGKRWKKGGFWRCLYFEISECYLQDKLWLRKSSKNVSVRHTL